jgi:hypothetical protein
MAESIKPTFAAHSGIAKQFRVLGIYICRSQQYQTTE